MEKGSHTKLKDLRGSSFRLHVLRAFLEGRKFQIENVVHLFKSATIECRLLNVCRHTLVSFMLFAWCPLLVLRWPLTQKPSMTRRVSCLWNRIAVRTICSLMTEVGQKLFLSLSAASTAVQLQLEEVTKASPAQMLISCGDLSHYECMTVKTQVSTVFLSHGLMARSRWEETLVMKK